MRRPHGTAAVFFLLWAGLLPWPGAGSRASSPVRRYDVILRPSLTEPFVQGSERIEFDGSADSGWPVCLPRNEILVETLRLDGVLSPVACDGPFIVIPRCRSAELAFTAWPRRGLEISGSTLYSVFSTSHWMPCLEEPSVRAPLDLTLVLPPSVEAVATGCLVSRAPLPEAGREAASGPLVAWRFELEEPYPSYLYGFAAGPFARARSSEGAVELEAVGDGVPNDKLGLLLEATGPMLDFFARRAGAPYPLPSYTQVVVQGDAAQEMAGMSVLGLDGLTEMLGMEEAPPAAGGMVEDWLPAHELSHAWWGNWITCGDWTHFWLNEGFAVFMTAAWKEHRWGKAGYEVEMERAGRRWKRAQDAGWDRPLAYRGAYPSMGMRNCIVYSKAAIFLDELRRTLGEDLFWKGVQAYTRGHGGESVVSADFEASMSKATGKDLRPIFRKWVDPPSE